ncbi:MULTISPECIES: DUF3293 domain-containing protein [unclassified Pseudoalteromonas]|uniref:DUF3293 domain-containing protein n=1 Tax=unclassified Pseudoalteromonas TaxID=194690 RepID=UPI0030142BD5
MIIEPSRWEVYTDCFFRPIKPLSPDSEGAIISLWNPLGQVYSVAANRRITRFWQGALQRQQSPHQLLWGGDKHMQYRELSVLLACNLNDAIHWSQRMQQLAFYFVEDHSITLFNTQFPSQHQQLKGTFAERIGYQRLPKRNQATT